MSSNLFAYPEAFDNAAWTKNACTASANVIAAPNGFVVADKIKESTSTAVTHYVRDEINFVSGKSYTLSAYLKRSERNSARLALPTALFGGSPGTYANFDLTSGGLGAAYNCTSSIVNVGDDWYRCSIKATCITTGTDSGYIYVLAGVGVVGNYTGIPGYGIYAWGAKTEIGSLTQYQPASGYIGWLDETAPEEDTAYLYLGDNEIRSLKSFIKATFPNIDAPINASAAEWNALDGLEADWATQLAAKADTTHTHDGEAIGVVTLGDGSRATTQALGDDSTKVATTAFTKLGIAAAGLSSAWEEVAVLELASTTSVAFTATSVYDHYRILSEGMQSHGANNLEMVFGTAATWWTTGYTWGVNLSFTSVAVTDDDDAELELDGTKNIQAGPFALDVHVSAKSGAHRLAMWKIAAKSQGAPAVFLGGGGTPSPNLDRWRIGFPSGSGASLSGRMVLLGRRA